MQKNHFTAAAILPLIDLTRLNDHTTASDIDKLVLKAQTYGVASVCVFPRDLDFISPNIDIKRTTVVNFPSGSEPHDRVVAMLKQIISSKRVDEIDYVFPYKAYLNGQKTDALGQCHELFQICKKNNLIFKVIIESGALPSKDIIYQISCDIIQSGCDFLKTSTGKQPIGATLPAAKAMLSAIVDSGSTCGIKLSGGISTLEQALSYMHLAYQIIKKDLSPQWFRIGASSLIDSFTEAQLLEQP